MQLRPLTPTLSPTACSKFQTNRPFLVGERELFLSKLDHEFPDTLNLFRISKFGFPVWTTKLSQNGTRSFRRHDRPGPGFVCVAGENTVQTNEITLNAIQ